MRAKLGLLELRLRVYSLAEVSQRNAEGGCWLILDGAHALQSPHLARSPASFNMTPAHRNTCDRGSG